MRPAKNNWPSGERSRSLLFVVQLIQEMLASIAYESFRVTTMDVKARLREVLRIADQVDREIIPTAALDPCIKELVNSLTGDFVVNQIVKEELEILKSRWGKSISQNEVGSFLKMIEMINKKISAKYKNLIEEKILEISAQEKIKNKEDLRKLINAYCATLINDGYSKEYILSELEARFFSVEIKKVEKRTLQRFFSIFNGKSKIFISIIPISANFAKYLDSINLGMTKISSIDDIPIDAKKSMIASSDYDQSNKYFIFRDKRLDRYAILRIAQEILSSLAAATYLGRRYVQFDWSSYGYVKTIRAKEGEIIENVDLVLQKHSSFFSKNLLREFKNQSTQLFLNFSEDSFDRMMSAVNMAALSRTSPRPENQLITLWSAIEVLLSDPPRGGPRILHYVDLLAPCVCIKYVRRYIIAIYDELQIHYRQRMNKFFKNNGLITNIDQYSAFTNLVFLQENKHLHKDFCEIFYDNPLALYRLWKLEKNFGTPANFLNSIKEHEQRVRWQLFRIYRTRNDIVHNGEIPSFLKPLVQNVFEYFRSAMNTILSRSDENQFTSSIDQIVAEVGFDFEICKSALAKLPSDLYFDDEMLKRFHR